MKSKIRITIITALAAFVFAVLSYPACADHIHPDSSAIASLRILHDGEDVGFRSHEVDIMSGNPIKLEAVSGEKNKPEKVIWKSNNEEVATVDEDGLVTVENEDGGTVSISCSSTDGSGRNCIMKLELVKKVHRISLSHYIGLTVRAQSVITLSPKYFAPDGTEYIPTDPQLNWEIYSGNEHAYFSNQSSGTLCTNQVDYMQTVRVVVKSGDNPQAAAVLSITVNPIVEQVRIVNNGVDVSDKELYFPAGVNVQLTADCRPDQKNSAIKWSSSSSSVSVADGLVTAAGPGKVIITAAAADGGGKSARVTIIFE